MIIFFRTSDHQIYAVGSSRTLSKEDLARLDWLFEGAGVLSQDTLKGHFIGPRKEMVTPWSTNAVEITQSMGIEGIFRIEAFRENATEVAFDPMLQQAYQDLGQDLFTTYRKPEPIRQVTDIAGYSQSEGLALSTEEIVYLEALSSRLGRALTDSEVAGFSQVNSEHCRHKIFRGTFIIDGEKKASSLFDLIRETSRKNHNFIVSAYVDNVAFVEGPVVEQFAPVRQDVPDFFVTRQTSVVLSLKAETHNFPTTVEPFNGAATGSGGEIRDRMAGGKGGIPLAGSAVYMTSYPRLDENRPWERFTAPRPWLYHAPDYILIKASDGASDYGNKFGQPLINGSLLTFEWKADQKTYAYDKVVMLAGGIGFAKATDSQKDPLHKGDKIILLGGDNYRIGMGGGAVSSVETGAYGNRIELNAVQRSNPEMQKRVMNAIRAMIETGDNPIISIHDHGAGGHLNCYSEMLEETGGTVHLDKLPVGDPTLSEKEIIINESQERMGIALRDEHLQHLERVARREKAPFYVVGEATGDKMLTFSRNNNGKPFELTIESILGSSPNTQIEDQHLDTPYPAPEYDANSIEVYLKQVLRLESVACKDWLTNKVDRCVTGKVATQQCCGTIQLPLNNLGVMMLDYSSRRGMATAVGHAPVAALIDVQAGSRLAIAEALTNLVWGQLTHGLRGVSLSANWMWPARNQGEDARLYDAVAAASEFAIQLGVNIPTGKDSLSMTQKYGDGTTVFSPGTVIISAAAEVEDVSRTVSTCLRQTIPSQLIYIDFSGTPLHLGGSALGQILGAIGGPTPDVSEATYFVNAFGVIQSLLREGLILAGHDISSGGMITTLLEMAFPTPGVGLELDFSELDTDLVKVLFAENPGIILQVTDPEGVGKILTHAGLKWCKLGHLTEDRAMLLEQGNTKLQLDIDDLRDTWYETSYLFDSRQRPHAHAQARFAQYKKQPLAYAFNPAFEGTLESYGLDPARKDPCGLRAAIIREKGVNGDREMAYCLHLAGFDVKDVHMTDLIEGREDLTDVQMIAFVGGFSNSDVLGSAKGWAGGFLYNDRARTALNNFYDREDTLSLGVCNGCQLMMELGLLNRDLKEPPRMRVNGSGRFESAFVNVTVPDNNSVMFESLAGSRLGIWVAHGEGRFDLGDHHNQFGVVARFSYANYPGNPNDSESNIAGLCSPDGRHLAIMPHLERSLYPWNWAHYPEQRKNDAITPWIEAYVNARKWVASRKNKV